MGGKEKSRVVVLVLLAAWLLAATPGGAASYLVYQQWGGTWQDANKTAWNTEDDLMCWAAAASNVLAWGGWGTSTYRTADQIFKYFQDHWTDNVGYIWFGYKYWLDGSNSPYSNLAVVDVPGGGAFYPGLNFYDYYAGSSRGNLLAAVDSLMRQGYGVGLTLSNGGLYSHAVTAWGFEFQVVDGLIQYSGLYLTDSDDGVWGLRYYPLTYLDGKWYLGGSYSGWRLLNYQAFHFYKSPGSSGGVIPIALGEPAGLVPAVPLPATGLLLGSALAVGWLRRRGKRIKAKSC